MKTQVKIKYKTYKVYYNGGLLDTISARNKKAIMDDYRHDNVTQYIQGYGKYWTLKLFRITEAGDATPE